MVADGGTVVAVVVIPLTPSDPLRIPDKDVDEVEEEVEMSIPPTLPLLLLLVVGPKPTELLADVPLIPVPPI